MDKEKSDQIIITAQKRFGLYGLEKTSMQEIANDLGLSKASLYYYFPDKESLYKAVIKKEQAEFIRKISEKINNTGDPEAILTEYVGSRLEYFRILMNLSRLKYEELTTLKPVLRDLLDSFREEEKSIVSGILKTGIENGLFVKMNAGKTAALFLDLLKGLRVAVITTKSLLIIDPEEFNILHDKTMEFTRIFINGIKKQQ